MSTDYKIIEHTYDTIVVGAGGAASDKGVGPEKKGTLPSTLSDAVDLFGLINTGGGGGVDE